MPLHKKKKLAEKTHPYGSQAYYRHLAEQAAIRKRRGGRVSFTRKAHAEEVDRKSLVDRISKPGPKRPKRRVTKKKVMRKKKGRYA